MQIHGPSESLNDDSRIKVELNPGSDAPFADMRIGPVSLYIKTPEECDWLIKVAVEAKRLLLGVPLAHEPVAPRCTSEHVNLGGARLQCSLHQGHPGRHTAALAIAPGSVPTAEWDDEPDPPEPGACACGHPGYEHIHAAPQPCTQCECKAFTSAPSGGVMFGPFSDDAAASMA